MTIPTRALGDLRVSPLCLGGNVFGWTADEAQSFAVLDGYADAGGTFLDTADVYSAWHDGNSGGESETLIGRWLARRGRRDDVVVATKGGGHPELRGLAASTIKRAAEESLRRLGTDHIDLYYTHFDDETVEVSEIMTALDDLVRAGKVRALGASNLSPARLEASLAFAAREGTTPYVALQPKYNLVSRDTYEGELAAVAAHHGLGALPYSGLASGFLTGKYRADTTIDSPRAPVAAGHLATERGRRVLAAVETVADAHGVPMASVALAWLAARPTVTAPIASARTTDQLPALLAAATLTLTDADLTTLTEASDTAA
ncbi:aldo/keto reductase [Streptomyces avicenniae]|uniref:aldo/keto reductase n=1 Tax=Streptomyces avicenniae TaxID=500153 RepID=UPI00069C1142|nr:aldo/keto reductase [Streptomyces avicenniae]